MKLYNVVDQRKGDGKMENFISRVKQILGEKKMTQKGLSKLSGIAEASLCRYIRGDSEPRIYIIANIAKALNVSEAYLIGESDKKQEDNYKLEIRDIVTRNRNIMTDKDRIDIINMLYGVFDDEK